MPGLYVGRLFFLNHSHAGSLRLLQSLHGKVLHRRPERAAAELPRCTAPGPGPGRYTQAPPSPLRPPQRHEWCVAVLTTVQ